MRILQYILGGLVALAAIVLLLLMLGSFADAFGMIPLVLLIGATGFGIWRLVESDFTMTGVREWLGAYNVLHVYFIVCMGWAAYEALNLNNEYTPNWDKFVVCAMAMAVYTLTGYFGRWRDNTLTAGQPWSPIAIVQGLAIAFSLFMPFVNVNPENLGWAADSWQMKFLDMVPFGWWDVSNHTLVGQVLFLHICIWCGYVLAAKSFDRVLRMVGLYWGMRAAYGATVLWWGLRFSDMTREVLVDTWLGEKIGAEFLATTSSVLWIAATSLFIIVTLGLKIWRDMDNSDKDFWYSAVSAPGVFKAFGSGGDISHFVANFTGVPHPAVGLPIWPGILWVLTRNFEAIWQWMLVDLDRRGDPRWFCNDNLWVGPGFLFPGIPIYTKVMELTEAMWNKFSTNPLIENLGNRKFGTLQRIADWDWEKGPLSTGRVDLVVKGSFGWRVINPFVMWNNNSWLKAIDNAIDRLAAGLVRVMRFDLYGESGTIASLAEHRAAMPASDDHPATPERLENPAVTVEDNTFIRTVAVQSGGLADERELEDVDVSDVAIRQAMTDDVSVHIMVERLRAQRVPEARINEIVGQMLIAQAMGRSGLDIGIFGGNVGALLAPPPAPAPPAAPPAPPVPPAAPPAPPVPTAMELAILALLARIGGGPGNGGRNP